MSSKESTKQTDQSIQNYQDIFSSAPIGIFTTTPEGRFLEGNPALARMFGYETPRELMDSITDIGTQIYADPADRKKALRLLEKHGEVVNFECRGVRKDGSTIWTSYTAKSMRDENGNILYYQGFITDITDRKHAEKALRESEELYRTMFENTGTSMVLIEDDMTISMVNEEFERYTGYSHDELIGTKWSEFVHPDDFERMTEQHRLRREDPGSALPGYEFRYRTKTGDIRDALLNVVIVPDTRKSIASLIDITERKQAEEALRENEEKFRNLAETTSTAIMIYQNDKWIYANPAAEEICGYTLEELMTMKFWDFIAPEFVKSVKERGQKRQSKELTVQEYEFKIITKQGEEKWVFLQGTSIEIKGAPAGLISVIDITDRKRAEAEHMRLITAIEQSAEGIYLTDTNWIIQYANPAFEKMLGYDKGEIIGWHTRLLKSGKHDRDYYRDIRETLIRGKVWSGRGINKKKDGTFIHADVTMSPVYDKSHNIINYVCIHRDISREITFEAELARAQKLESIGTLAGGIAHDFNNLLMGIQGNASLMMLDLDSSHPHHIRLKHIEEQVRSAADLTAQLLGFARGGRYEVKPTDMNDIVERTSAMFGRTKKEITIHGKYGKDLWTVEADRTQMEQVFMNLYVNAWHAMPGGGEIYLETENIHIDDTHSLALAPGKYVKISVTDTGVGMDEKTRERIFDPFFTTKEMGRGTGMGLATVYGIITGHRGMINVDSDPGHGSTFTIYLPATEKAAITEPIGEEKILQGTETILLVDDEVAVLDIARDMLKYLGYRVYCAGRSQVAVALYYEKKDEIDLVIVDMIMPGTSGGETFDLIREIDPSQKVLLSSGYSIDGAAQKIIDRGCDGFLQKPFKLEQLSQEVRAVLDRNKDRGK